ncbi:hypothetical protein K7X86_00070, partial [Candidatus Sulcia muelleri]|nr:hypothetical protein [Candidatus Karelsulcia muelleri]
LYLRIILINYIYIYIYIYYNLYHKFTTYNLVSNTCQKFTLKKKKKMNSIIYKFDIYYIYELYKLTVFIYIYIYIYIYFATHNIVNIIAT